MATVSNTLRTCNLLLIIIFSVYAKAEALSEPWIASFKVDNKSCVEKNCKYLLNVRGGEFLGHYSWRLTPSKSARGGSCDVIYPTYELKEIETQQWHTKTEVIVPNSDGKIYFCIYHPNDVNSPFGGKWVHQGNDLFLDPKNDVVCLDTEEEEPRARDVSDVQSNLNMQSNKLVDSNTPLADLSHDTDVNYLPAKNSTTKKQRRDIDIFYKDEYTPPLKWEVTEKPREDAEKIQNELQNSYSAFRKKRETIKVKNFDESLISPHEILMAKNSSNYIKPVHHEETSDDALIRVRKERQTEKQISDFTTVKAVPAVVKIEGLRVDDSEKDPKITENGIPSVLADTKVTIRLFGEGLTSRTVISFTHDRMEFGQHCKFLVKDEYLAKKDSVTSNSALFEIIAPSPPPDSESQLYICAKNLKPEVTDPFNDEEKYIHQGTDPWKVFSTHKKLLPLWTSLILILICLMFSALFSGLNLGLMSLDRTELKIISNTGTEQERKYARAIMPVRDHGNYLLCSILLGNVAVNSTFTILLDELTSGLFAVIFSTLAIVLLGEITPQAICSRHGLMVGAKSIMVTKAVMALTAPLAFPVSKLLDFFLGEEIGNVYNRERLKELVKVVTGTFKYSDSTTGSECLCYLEESDKKLGFSRIPVYEGNRGNIVTVLFIKDLAFVDPDDNTPLRTLCQYYQNSCNFVFEDVTLDVMFRQFKEGHKGHMAFVHRINNEGEGDPFYETIGLVTLEDVIEELIQAEIVDETDVFMDNRTKRRRNRPQNKLQDFAAFAERHENQRIHISPQLTLASFQFLSTSVDAFKPDTVSETVLRRLLRQDVIHHVKVKGKSKKDPAMYVYQQGKPVDYFVLILEGRVEVTVGRENLVFEAGPFTYFGVQALIQNVGVAESPTPSAMGSLQNINMDSMLRHTFVPDYSVRAITELFYLTVKRSLYLAAKRATLMEKGALSKGATNEQFDTEVDKLLQSVDEDISISGDQKTPSRQVSPNPPAPVSASPHTRASFASRSSLSEPRNGDPYGLCGVRADEQEKLLKSPH